MHGFDPRSLAFVGTKPSLGTGFAVVQRLQQSLRLILQEKGGEVHLFLTFSWQCESVDCKKANVPRLFLELSVSVAQRTHIETHGCVFVGSTLVGVGVKGAHKDNHKFREATACFSPVFLDGGYGVDSQCLSLGLFCRRF